MSGAIEELVVPVRMDTAGAAQDLKKVEKAGKDAGDATKKGFDDAGESAKGLGNELANIMKAQLSFAAIKQAAGAMGDEFRRSSDYVKGLAEQFANVRQAMQQVAALRGEDNSNKFTLQQVQEGAKAGLTPQEWIKAQEEFQSRAGAYVGKDAGDQMRLNDQEGAEYQQKIAAFAKARGISPDEAMGLGGGLLQFSEGKQNVGDLMGRYGKVFKTLERAPTPVKQLLPQMSRVMAQGFSPEEAAQALAITSEAMPGEEETGVENAMKAITDAKLEGKGEQLGIKEGMTPMQQLEAASRTLKGRVDKGENVDELMKEYAPDLRQRRGLLAFMNRGVGAQGFERTRRYAEETPQNFTEEATAKYRDTEEGQAAQRRADQALAEARRGKEMQPIMAELEKAKIDVTNRGDLEEGRVSNLYQGAIGTGTGVAPEQQIINEEAINRLRRKAFSKGITEDDQGKFQADRERGVKSSDVVYRSQASVNEEIKDLLKRIAAAGEKQADKGDKAPAMAMPAPMNNGGARQ
jgi:hypothetical protein